MSESVISSRGRRLRTGVRTVFYAAALCVMMGAGPAYATCAQGDLAGTWRFYIKTGSDWLRCKVVVKPNGQIDATKSSCKGPPPDRTKFTLSGTVTLLSAAECTFNGSLSFDGPGSNDFTGTIEEASINRSKNSWNGVGQFGNGVTFGIDANKR